MTDRRIDVDRIAIDVAEQIRRDFLDEVVEERAARNPEFPKLVERAVSSSVAELREAYAPQRKTYAMTTDHLSEPAKKDHEALYRKEVDALERLSIEVDAADRESVATVGSGYRDAKQDEVHCLNAVYLHELYFSNCFDPNSELFLDALPYMRLARDWGTFDAWMADFMACALASRGGWVVCGYSLYLKRLTNVFTDGNDRGVLVGIVPLIVIDMFEHAFVRDYGNDKRSYLTAMMRELDWQVIEDRFDRVEALQKVMG